MADIRDMIGKDVEVISNGTAFRGKLIEVSETEVYIKTLLQWLALPAVSVSSLKLVEKGASGITPTFPVDASAGDAGDIHEIEEIHDVEEIDEGKS